MIAEFFAAHQWTIYVLVFLGPFVQEDAAILGAATASAAHHGQSGGLYGAALLGLVLSDTWKYWAGALAYKWPRAAKWTADPRVTNAKHRVLGRLGVTMIAARFIPGTRIPLYFACGLFKAPFLQFFFLILVSAALYLAIAFVVLAVLGAMAGRYIQAIAVTIVIGCIVYFIASHLNARRSGP